EAGLQAVDHGQQALRESLDRELARPGHFLFGPATGVLDVGLGAQELLGEFGVLALHGCEIGLQLIQQFRLIGGLRGFALLGAGIGRRTVVWVQAWFDPVVLGHGRLIVSRHGLFFGRKWRWAAAWGRQALFKAGR